MGLTLAQIINKVLPVQLSGSNIYKSVQLNITTTPYTWPLSFSANSFQFTNDGSDFITAWLQNEAPATVTSYNDSHITYNGTGWSSMALNVGTVNYTSNTSASAIYNPNTTLDGIGFSLVYGSSGGNVSFQLSNDGGVTWKNPSTIAGVMRNDGVIGTSMDSTNTYASGASYSQNFIFSVPSGNWQIKVSPTTNSVFVFGGVSNGVNGIIIKPGESKTYPINSSSVTLASNSGTQSVRLDVIS